MLCPASSLFSWKAFYTELSPQLHDGLTSLSMAEEVAYGWLLLCSVHDRVVQHVRSMGS